MSKRARNIEMYSYQSPSRRLAIKVLFCALILVGPAHSQDVTATQDVTASVSDAKITFYSNKITLTGGTRGKKPGAFMGRIFDGDHELAFMVPARFVTFRVRPGLHVFTATSWMSKSANFRVRAQITMDLAANEHYFFESGTLSDSPTFVLQNVTCAEARQDNTRTKPLKSGHLRPDGIPIVVSETSFPQCPVPHLPVDAN